MLHLLKKIISRIMISVNDSDTTHCEDRVSVVPAARLTPQNEYILIINTSLEARIVI